MPESLKSVTIFDEESKTFAFLGLPSLDSSLAGQNFMLMITLESTEATLEQVDYMLMVHILAFEELAVDET